MIVQLGHIIRLTVFVENVSATICIDTYVLYSALKDVINIEHIYLWFDISLDATYIV